MPDSLRQRIENAIVAAQDEAQRIMLMLMLAMHDAIDETRTSVHEVRDGVDALAKQFAEHSQAFVAHDSDEKRWRGEHFRGISPDVHVDHHGVVGEIIDDQRASRELRHEAAKGFVSQAGKMIAVGIGSAIAAAAAIKGLGM
jgi:hypothetical protein